MANNDLIESMLTYQAEEFNWPIYRSQASPALTPLLNLSFIHSDTDTWISMTLLQWLESCQCFMNLV